MKPRITLDMSVLFQAITSNGVCRPIYVALGSDKLELIVSNSILYEYELVIKREFSRGDVLWDDWFRLLTLLSARYGNVIHVNPSILWQLL